MLVKDIKEKYESPALGRRFSWRPDLPSTVSAAALAAREQVERKIREGVYEFEHALCFCGGNEGVVLAARDYYGFFYPLTACRRCGLLRANPRMTASSYARFYDEEYRAAYGDNDDHLDDYFQENLHKGNQVFNYVMEHLPPDTVPNVVFEIGCNMGAMLTPWRKAGCEVHGTDFNRNRIEEGRKRTGIQTLYAGGLDRLEETEKKADLIILHHVLEHFLDMEKDLQRIRALLNQSGYLYIAVPGTFGWVERHCGGDILGLLQNAHTYQFSLATLRYVLECSGFECIHGNEEIVSLFRETGVHRRKDDLPPEEFDRVLQYLKRMERSHTPTRYLKALAESLGIKETIKSITGKSA